MKFKDLQNNLKTFFEAKVPEYFLIPFTLISEDPLERVNEDAFCYYIGKRQKVSYGWSASLGFDIQVRNGDLETLIDEALEMLTKEASLGGNVSSLEITEVTPFVDAEDPNKALVYIETQILFSLDY